MTELNERLDKQLSKMKINEEQSLDDQIYKQLYKIEPLKVGRYTLVYADEEFTSGEKWMTFMDKEEYEKGDNYTVNIEIIFPGNDGPSKKVKPGTIKVEVGLEGLHGKKSSIIISTSGKSPNSVVSEIKSYIKKMVH